MRNYVSQLYKNGMKLVTEYSKVYEVEDKSSVIIADLQPGTQYAVAIQAKQGNDKFSKMVDFATSKFCSYCNQLPTMNRYNKNL